MSILNPVWVKPASIAKKTLDPLGLDRVSDRLIGDLLTGITALTNRTRYYSFYTWAVKNVNEVENITGFDEFENAFFDRDRAYTLACIAHEQSSPEGDHSNIQGLQEGKKKWQVSKTAVTLKGFRHLQNSMGGYGYYYQASIRKLGLTKQEQTRDSLTILGEGLAKAFEKTVSGTDYYKKWIGKEVIKKSVLAEYGSHCCLCILHRKNAPEREILRKIILGMNQEALGDTYHENRQKSLAFVLCAIHNFGQKSENLGSQAFLDLAYFKQFLSEDLIMSFDPPLEIADIIEKWKTFRSHDYFAFACESLFQAFLKTLDIHRTTGLSFSDFISQIDETESVNELKALLVVRREDKISKRIRLNEILKLIVASATGHQCVDFDAEASRKFDLSCNLGSKINENVLAAKLSDHFETEDFSLSRSTILALLLSLFVYVRLYWRSKTKDKPFTWLASRSEASDLSPSNFIFKLEHKLVNANPTMFDFLSWIYKDFVFTQATNVYNQKVGSSVYSLPISWFHPDGEVYRIDRLYDARFRNSRFHSCLSILTDLGLCKSVKDHQELTKDGRDLLQKLGVSVK